MSIFNKLQDPRGYTGTHKHRFDEVGRGKGKTGRSDSQANIFDLSQITRPNLQPGGTNLTSSHRERVRHQAYQERAQRVMGKAPTDSCVSVYNTERRGSNASTISVASSRGSSASNSRATSRANSRDVSPIQRQFRQQYEPQRLVDHGRHLHTADEEESEYAEYDDDDIPPPPPLPEDEAPEKKYYQYRKAVAPLSPRTLSPCRSPRQVDVSAEPELTYAPPALSPRSPRPVVHAHTPREPKLVPHGHLPEEVLNDDLTMEEVFFLFTPTGEMDNTQFFRLCRDCHLLDKRFARTDADVVFAKVKNRGERKISFDQFQSLVIPTIAAEKGVRQGEVIANIMKGRPRLNNPTATNTTCGIYNYLTDSKHYTGSHKERFDEDGHGKGFAGRDHWHYETGKLAPAMSSCVRGGMHCDEF